MAETYKITAERVDNPKKGKQYFYLDDGTAYAIKLEGRNASDELTRLTLEVIPIDVLNAWPRHPPIKMGKPTKLEFIVPVIE